MKHFILLIASILSFVTVAQDLAPDQNPNYKKAQEKYMDNYDEQNASQGTTLQNTYEAIDEFGMAKELRHERKMQRIENRHDRRMARINRRTFNNAVPPYPGFNPYLGYGYNNGFGRPFFQPNVFLGGTIYPQRRRSFRPYLGVNVGYGWGL